MPSAPTLTPPALSPGQGVGPYSVLTPLRSGGMAALYLARRAGPGGFERLVALKVIHAHLGKRPDFVRMFLEEARLSARIRHPNVVSVEELGEHAGSFYLVMEYVDGITLGDLLERLCASGACLPPRLAVGICCAVLEGLHAAHTLCGAHGESLDVVHRDVSPSNIMIDRAGHVRLIDFGVARVRGRAVETGVGVLKGKLAYMSPEQACGLELDQRSDLYSLAVVLWEALAMRRMHDGLDDLAVLERVRAAVVPAWEVGELRVPSTLRAALSRSLTARDERPGDARLMRRELLDALPEARTLDAAELAAFVAPYLGPAVDGAPSFTRPDEATLAPTPVGTRLCSMPRRTPESSRKRLTLALAVLAAVCAGAWLALPGDRESPVRPVAAHTARSSGVAAQLRSEVVASSPPQRPAQALPTRPLPTHESPRRVARHLPRVPAAPRARDAIPMLEQPDF